MNFLSKASELKTQLIKSLKKFNHAFTLIELLIAITIVSLLFGVVISSTGALRSSSNDAKRKADLAQIQSALQNYYADLNYFPRSSGANAFVLGPTPATTLTSNIGLVSPAPDPLPAPKTYLRVVPNDPAAPYCYIAVNNSQANNSSCDNSSTFRCNYYYLSVRLDNPGTSNPPPPEAQCSFSTNYYVTP